MKKHLLVAISLLLASQCIVAQVAKSSDLFQALKKQDSIFFERSFNLCDLAYLSKAIHPDIVFYHDQGGVQNRAQFMEAVKNNICGDSTSKPIRKIVKESMEVFPMYNNGVLYAALQTGVHDFYIRERNKPDQHTSRARFTHLYVLEKGEWLLKEVLSYDHRDPNKAESKGH